MRVRGSLQTEFDGNGAIFSFECMPGICDEIENDLMDFVLFDCDGRQLRLDFEDKPNAPWDGSSDQLDCLSQGRLRMGSGNSSRQVICISENLVRKLTGAARAFYDVNVAVCVIWR